MPVSAENLLELDRLRSISLSPSQEEAVVHVERSEKDTNQIVSSLWVLSLLGGPPRKLFESYAPLHSPIWCPVGNKIGFIMAPGGRDQQIYLIDGTGGKPTLACEILTGVAAFRWAPSGRHLAVLSWVWPNASWPAGQRKCLDRYRQKRDSAYITTQAQARFLDRMLPADRVPHLLWVNLNPGENVEISDLMEGTPYHLPFISPGVNDFDISPCGQYIIFSHQPGRLAQSDTPAVLAEISLCPSRINIVPGNSAYSMRAPRYSPNGAEIACLLENAENPFANATRLATWDKAQGKLRIVPLPMDCSPRAPLHWESDKNLFFITEMAGRTHLYKSGLDNGELDLQVIGGWVQSFDGRAETLVYLMDSANFPPRAYRWDSLDPRRIDTFNDEWLSKAQLGFVEELWFEGAASTTEGADRVQMWVTYPPTHQLGQRYPLLHLIHGGPHAATGDCWNYRWNPHLFAAQGFLVVGVNYHGSSGFGLGFQSSITGRCGELEMRDIEAATEFLEKRSLVDRERLYAAGASYGGFLVAMLNANPSPRLTFKALVCHAGFFDWAAAMASDAWPWLSRDLGANWLWNKLGNSDYQSPISRADRMRTPMLLVHGALDYRAPDAQSWALYHTLCAQGVDARLMWFPDEGHHITQPCNVLTWQGEILQWLLKPN